MLLFRKGNCHLSSTFPSIQKEQHQAVLEARKAGSLAAARQRATELHGQLAQQIAQARAAIVGWQGNPFSRNRNPDRSCAPNAPEPRLPATNRRGLHP